MRTTSILAIGASWGAAVAAAFTLLAVTAMVLGWLTGAGASPRGSVGLVAAWWLATPACAAAAAWSALRWRTLGAAMLWAPICSAAWVAAIHAGVRGRIPADAGEWLEVLLRAVALGACAALVAWHTLRHAGAARSGDGAGLATTAAGHDPDGHGRRRRWPRRPDRRHEPPHAGGDVPR